MSQYPTCIHVKTNGVLCGSPALEGEPLCFFHHRDRRRRHNLQQARQAKLSAPKSASPDDLNAEILESLEFPLLEDAAAIQVALTSVARALASNHLDPRRAALLVYALQVAAYNLHRVRLKALPSESVALADPDPIADLLPFNRSAAIASPQRAGG